MDSELKNLAGTAFLIAILVFMFSPLNNALAGLTNDMGKLIYSVFVYIWASVIIGVGIGTIYRLFRT